MLFLPLAVGQNLADRGRDDGGRGVGDPVLLLAPDLVFELGETGPWLVRHGEIKHAGRHVVLHELDVEENLASVLVRLAALIQQLVPTENRRSC